MFEGLRSHLKLKGPDPKGNYTGRCPFHDDRSPSLSVHPVKGWICFAGCGNGSLQTLAKRLGMPDGEDMREPEAIYQYRAEDGALLFEVVRFPGKNFRYRRPASDGWTWNRKGVKSVLYRLPELLAAPKDETVCLPEGERDVDILFAHRQIATCNPGGAGKFTRPLAGPLEGRNVVIIPDKDEAGRRHARSEAALLHGLAASIKIVELPGDDVNDVSDWFNAGGTAEELKSMCTRTPEWQPDEPERAKNNAACAGPIIVINDRYLREITDEAWDTVAEANDPPYIFQRGRMIVDVVLDDEGQPILRTVDRPAFKNILDRLADWVKLNDKGVMPGRPPADVLADMMASKELPLPFMFGITTAPILSGEGQVETGAGYQAQTRHYLHLPPGLNISDVADNPGPTALKKARALLLDELLCDFPFAGDADLANAIAVLLLPFVRLLIDGPTPLHLIESPTPGTGKGLLVDALSIPAVGEGPAIMTEGRDEDEYRKRITAKLLQAPRFVLIDNIRSRLDSAALSAALTASRWEDRVLGHSRTATLPVTCVWLATANNPGVSLEIARRTVSIRLDSGQERPWLRSDFRHPDLRRWAKEHRGELVWAALTLARAWVAAGRPEGHQSLGSYESWAGVMGGILDVAGVRGFLGNVGRVYEVADQELQSWAAFCAAWWGEYQDMPVGTDLLFGLATRHRLLLDIWGGRDDHSRRTRFGIALSKMRDRVVDSFQVRHADPDTHGKVARYRLVDLRGVRGVAGGLAHSFSSTSVDSTSSPQDQVEYKQAHAARAEDEKIGAKKAPQAPATPRSDPWDDFLDEVEDGTG